MGEPPVSDGAGGIQVARCASGAIDRVRLRQRPADANPARRGAGHWSHDDVLADALTYQWTNVALCTARYSYRCLSR